MRAQWKMRNVLKTLEIVWADDTIAMKKGLWPVAGIWPADTPPDQLVCALADSLHFHGYDSGQMTVAANARLSESGGHASVASKRLVVAETGRSRCAKVRVRAGQTWQQPQVRGISRAKHSRRARITRNARIRRTVVLQVTPECRGSSHRLAGVRAGWFRLCDDWWDSDQRMECAWRAPSAPHDVAAMRSILRGYGHSSFFASSGVVPA